MADLREALTAAQTYRGAARAALAGRLAARPIDDEQRAAHGFAWVATTVAALEATLGWFESGQDSNPLDAKIVTLAFAEGIGQLTGGLPMGQNEMFRPADLGLGAAARTLADACARLLDADHGATRADVAAALAADQWPSDMPEPLTFKIAFRLSSSDQPQPLSTASTCGAKASLSSTRSMSPQPRPLRANSRSTAGTGPMPIRLGSQPAAAEL